MDDPSVQLRVVADVDGPTWALDHARGRRPDASPYGLHRLAEHGFLVTDGTRPPPSGRLARRVDGSLRHRGAGFEWWASARARSGGDDVVVCWDERTGVPALVGPVAAPVATGVIWLTDARPRAPWAAPARRALRRAAAVWALSETQLPVLRDEWGVTASRLHHVPFGIDAQFWSPAAGDPPSGVAERPVVLGVGNDRNDRHRDHAALVAAVAGLPAQLELVTAAPVHVPPAVGERIPALDHVTLRERYRRAAVVVTMPAPNTHASGVTTLLEAQATGRAVVVTDSPGIRAYLVPGVTADVVPVGDVDAARRAVAGLLPARAAAMGAAGREFVLAHATSSGMVAHLATVLRST